MYAALITARHPLQHASLSRQQQQLVRCQCRSPQWFCRPQSARCSRGLYNQNQRRIRQRRNQIAASLVEKLNAEELEVALADRDRPLVIDFSANWCGPCLLLAQELEKVAEQLGDKVRLVKVDTDENPELSSQLQIQGLPTMVFVGVDKDKPALRTEGLLPAETIIEIIQKEMPQ